MPFSQESEKLVEPAIERMKRLVRPEMPFAEHPGGISSGFEIIGNRLLPDRQPDVRQIVHLLDRIDLMPKPLLISPGKKPGPARAAIRRGDIPAGEANAAASQRIEMRRGNIAALATHLSIPLIVGDDQDDMCRRMGRRFVGGQGDGVQGRNTKSDKTEDSHVIFVAWAARPCCAIHSGQHREQAVHWRYLTQTRASGAHTAP